MNLIPAGAITAMSHVSGPSFLTAVVEKLESIENLGMR